MQTRLLRTRMLGHISKSSLLLERSSVFVHRTKAQVKRANTESGWRIPPGRRQTKANEDLAGEDAIDEDRRRTLTRWKPSFPGGYPSSAQARFARSFVCPRLPRTPGSMKSSLPGNIPSDPWARFARAFVVFLRLPRIIRHVIKVFFYLSNTHTIPLPPQLSYP